MGTQIYAAPGAAFLPTWENTTLQAVAFFDTQKHAAGRIYLKSYN